MIPRQGQPVRISMHIQGIPRFKALARSHVPPEALEGVRVRMAHLDTP